jgi:alkylation response protein AidB-like acyl-CoA dehydrogenase
VGKYAGLSFFLMPMKVSGVQVLPLIKMTGEGGFNQVIMSDAPMPADAMLGKPGQGWEVAMATLTFERGAAEGTGGGQATATAESVHHVARLARKTLRDGRPASDDPLLRALVLALMNQLVYSEYGQKLSELACEILGPGAALWMGDPHAPDGAEWPRAYMNSFGMTIGGGTSEIQRNILGERVLGLPKSK